MKKMQKAQIVEQLSDTKFVIELTPENELQAVDQFAINHDFVEFSGSSLLFTDMTKCELLKNQSVSNCISLRNTVQIPIYGFFKVILPLLNSNKYLQPEHVLQPVKDEYGIEIPGRFNYDYTNAIFKFFNRETNQFMYAVKLEGEADYNIVTAKFYKEFIEPRYHDK